MHQLPVTSSVRIQCILVAWKQKDLPASCIKPIPIQVLKHIAFMVTNLPPNSELLHAAANMMINAWFSLLCQGKYKDSNVTNATPFNLVNCKLDLQTASNAELLNVCSALLTFTGQKMGSKTISLPGMQQQFFPLPCVCHLSPYSSSLSTQCSTDHIPGPHIYIIWASGCHLFLHHYTALSDCELSPS